MIKHLTRSLGFLQKFFVVEPNFSCEKVEEEECHQILDNSLLGLRSQVAQNKVTRPFDSEHFSRGDTAVENKVENGQIYLTGNIFRVTAL